jgi:hypothetical protein
MTICEWLHWLELVFIVMKFVIHCQNGMSALLRLGIILETNDNLVE